MTTSRDLIYEDDVARTFEVRDRDGNVIGRDVESKVEEPPGMDVRIAALEDEVRGMRDRVASVEAISDDVKAMRDAIAPGKRD